LSADEKTEGSGPHGSKHISTSNKHNRKKRFVSKFCNKGRKEIKKIKLRSQPDTGSKQQGKETISFRRGERN
jgi:hypothetical protein